MFPPSLLKLNRKTRIGSNREHPGEGGGGKTGDAERKARRLSNSRESLSDLIRINQPWTGADEGSPSETQ